MAIYKLSETTPPFFGSLQGSTFQRCGLVFAIRKHNAPVLKKTPKQSQSKNRFDATQKRFKNLSSADQQTFADSSPTYERTNSLGNQYTLSAINLQTSSNIQLSQAGQPLINTITVNSPFPSLTLLFSDIKPSTQEYQAIITGGTVPPGYSLKIEASTIIPGGGSRDSSDYKFIGNIPENGDTTTFDFFQQYVQAFGNPTGRELQGFYTRVSLTRNATGQSGTYSFNLGTVLP